MKKKISKDLLRPIVLLSMNRSLEIRFQMMEDAALMEQTNVNLFRFHPREEISEKSKKKTIDS